MATVDEWVAAFARALGQPPPSDQEVARILDLARVAAHRSERRAAPLACWLAAAADLSPEQALVVAEDLPLPLDGDDAAPAG